MQFDFGVFDKNHKLIAVLEVKALLGTDSDWATQFRRNLAAHAGAPSVPFFGLVTPEHLYLWTTASTGGPPDFEADVREVFKRFARSTTPPPTAFAFELHVASWLSQLLQDPREAPQALKESGLLAAARDGYVSAQVAA